MRGDGTTAPARAGLPPHIFKLTHYLVGRSVDSPAATACAAQTCWAVSPSRTAAVLLALLGRRNASPARVASGDAGRGPPARPPAGGRAVEGMDLESATADRSTSSTSAVGSVMTPGVRPARAAAPQPEQPGARGHPRIGVERGRQDHDRSSPRRHEVVRRRALHGGRLPDAGCSTRSSRRRSPATSGRAASLWCGEGGRHHDPLPQACSPPSWSARTARSTTWAQALSQFHISHNEDANDDARRPGSIRGCSFRA